MNVYELVTDKILEKLKAGVVPWKQPWKGGAAGCPKNLVSGKDYRGANVFLLAMQGYVSPYFVTYKQAQDKGGQVRKGEKGSPIIYWATGEKKDKPGEKYFMLRYYTVFNVGQCDNVKAPETGEITPTDFNPIAECEAVVSAYADAPKVTHTCTKLQARACYHPGIDAVTMPDRGTFIDAEHYYSTLFHELVHSTGHEKRLAREFGACFANHAYSFEELVAECGAAFLCGQTGIVDKTLDDSASYIASWMRKLKDEPRWMVEAASKAAKAADWIRGVKAQEDVTA